jgi:hypothetical protein
MTDTTLSSSMHINGYCLNAECDWAALSNPHLSESDACQEHSAQWGHRVLLTREICTVYYPTVRQHQESKENTV